MLSVDFLAGYDKKFELLSYNRKLFGIRTDPSGRRICNLRSHEGEDVTGVEFWCHPYAEASWPVDPLQQYNNTITITSVNHSKDKIKIKVVGMYRTPNINKRGDGSAVLKHQLR